MILKEVNFSVRTAANNAYDKQVEIIPPAHFNIGCDVG